MSVRKMLQTTFLTLGLAAPVFALAAPAQNVAITKVAPGFNQTANTELVIAAVHGPDLDAAADVLGLTEAQQRSIQALIEARRLRDDEAVRSVMAARSALTEILESDNPTALGVGQAYLDIGAREKELAASAERFASEVEATLTGEQQQRLAELRQASSGIAALGSLGLINVPRTADGSWVSLAPVAGTVIKGVAPVHVEHQFEFHEAPAIVH